MRLDLTSLNLVLAIEQTRSITRGAKSQHLALAAASKRLSDLETRLGVQLFERRARGVEPTEACRALVGHIRTLHASLHALESEVVEFARGIKGHLRIAANAGAIAECLPPDLAAFSASHAQVRISLEDMTSSDVQNALLAGDVDAGVFTAPILDPRVQTWLYRQGRLAVLVPRGHRLAARASVRFDELLDDPLIGLHAGAAAQDMLVEQARQRGRTLNMRLQVRGFDAIAQLVEARMGVAVLPQAPAERFAQLFQAQALHLDEPWAVREYLLGVLRQERLPAVLQRFVEALCPAVKADGRATAPLSALHTQPAPGESGGATLGQADKPTSRAPSTEPASKTMGKTSAKAPPPKSPKTSPKAPPKTLSQAHAKPRAPADASAADSPATKPAPVPRA